MLPPVAPEATEELGNVSARRGDAPLEGAREDDAGTVDLQAWASATRARRAEDATALDAKLAELRRDLESREAGPAVRLKAVTLSELAAPAGFAAVHVKPIRSRC